MLDTGLLYNFVQLQVSLKIALYSRPGIQWRRLFWKQTSKSMLKLVCLFYFRAVAVLYFFPWFKKLSGKVLRPWENQQNTWMMWDGLVDDMVFDFFHGTVWEYWSKPQKHEFYLKQLNHFKLTYWHTSLAQHNVSCTQDIVWKEVLGPCIKPRIKNQDFPKTFYVILVLGSIEVLGFPKTS